MPRNIYRIIREGTVWTLWGAGRVVGRWRLRDNALRRAHELAYADQPSLVALYRPDGSCEREWTYGHDPYPAPG